MLPKTNRLTRKKDFDTVFKKGKAIKNKLCIIRALPTSRKESRFGIMVSKKVSPSAVARNVIRRRLAALAAQHTKTPGRAFDVVIVALPPMLGTSFLQMDSIVRESFKKLI